MAYPLHHKLLTIQGALFGGADRWSIGLRFPTWTEPSGVTQAQVDACETPIRTWFTSTSSFIAANHSVDLIKLAPIGTDGKYPDGLDAVEKIPTTAINGGGTGGSWAPQLSLVIGLTTSVPRGRAHIGRVYPPPLRATLIPNPGIDSTTLGSYLGTFKTLLNSLAAISGLSAPAVMSKIGAGLSNPVTGLRAGRVIDTQRRRRAQISEDYINLAL